MKQTITLFALLLLSLVSRSQTYIPFPSSGAMWTERHGNGEAPASYWAYSLMNGDTVLGMTNYHKLYKATDAGFNTWSFVGGLREDGTKHIYFYPAAASSEQLLYDFNVSIGDTIDAVPGPGGTVSSIDSVLIAGQYHKRFNFNTITGTPWPSGSWIEGIGNGSLGGLLYSAMAQPTCDCANNIICFSKDDNWVYHNPAYASTDCMGSTADVAAIPAISPVSFFPNPVTGTSYIHIQGSHAFKECVVYNVNGTAVFTYNISAGEDIAIQKDKLPAGIYCYRLSGDHADAITGKFIVQ